MRKIVITFILLFSSFAIPQNNWRVQTSGVTTTLNCVRVLNNNIAWAAGDSGVVIRTIDGGITWNLVGGGILGKNIIFNIDAVDGNIAFVTFTSSSITQLYRTTNGGSNWESVFSQSGGFINDIHMIDPLNGLAYGDPVDNKWTIIRTTDGGTSWNRISTEPSPNGFETGAYCNSLCITDTLHIWFLGDQRVYRSSDGGLTWTDSFTPDYYSSIWFINDSVGMSSSNSNGGLSTDSGIIWDQISIPGSGNYYSLAGSGTRDFWTASDGYVYHTIDFGTNWSSELIFFGNIFAMDFVTIGSNAIGYLAGTNGTIARYEGPITSVSEISTILNKYSLEQNYPNPFNPSTKISWQSPVNSWQTLKVYDVLGNEVSTLVNEYRDAGNYNLEFNANKLSSGVYFYQLKARDFVETKKMILMK